MTKRYLTGLILIITCMAMLSLWMPVAAASSYTDVPEDAWYGEAAEDLTEAEWTAEDRADREEGFVPAEETQESAEEQQHVLGRILLG